MNQLHSMTAFSRQEQHTEWGDLIWEIRTVNHRYLELSFRLPDSLSALESQLREVVRRYLQRGKIDLTLRYSVLSQNAALTINQSLVGQLLNTAEHIAKESKVPGQLNCLDLLRWPGVIQNNTEQNEAFHQKIIQLLESALKNLCEVRAREGAALKSFLLQRVDQIEIHALKVHERLPLLAKALREKVLTRLQELNTNFDQSRLEQELVYLAQKMDVHEELDRLQTHVIETRRILNAGGNVGRRLDFLLQELQREINTLGAKINDAVLANSVVEVKVLIEQMREQIQNLE